MRVIIEQTEAIASVRAANMIADLIRKKPNCVIGLATGSSPLACYKELIRMHNEDGLHFSNVRTFNLDEYVGLAPEHPQSYHHFMRENLFDHVNLKKENTNVPDGLARDFEKYCEEYENQIESAGWIDLQLLCV